MADQRKQRIEEHQAHALLKEVSSLIGDAVKDTGLSEQAVAYLRRAETVLSHARARLAKTTPQLTPIPALDNTASYLTSSRTEIQSFVSNRDEGHLANLDTYMDSLLTQIQLLPQLPFRVEEQIAAQAAQAYADRLQGFESSLRASMRGVKENLEQATGTLARIKEQIVEFDQAARAKVAAMEAQAEVKLAELRTEIDSQKGRLDEAISQMQSTFGQSQQRYLETFNESEQTRQATFQSETHELISSEKQRLDELTRGAEELVATLQGHEEQARQIVGITAAAGAAGAYGQEAKEQRTQANIWRLVTVVIGLVLLGSTVLAIAFGLPDDTSVSELVTFGALRLPVGFALIGVFLYAMSESSKHRERERRARHRMMELTGFRPFLAELPDADVQTEIKEGVRRYFRGDEPPPLTGSGPND